MKAAPTARELLAGVEVLKGMNERQARKVPDDAPTSFVRKRWESLVRTEGWAGSALLRAVRVCLS
jgi:hypothetical protein